VPHRNAPLTALSRLRLARAIVDKGWPTARAAERFQASRTTAHRWAQRYRDQGPAGMTDRSSRPHHSPRRTPAPVVRRIVHLRWTQRLGPAQIGPRVSLAASTVHGILVRCRMSRLAHLDRAIAQPIRRYGHDHPGALVTSTSRSWATSPPGVAPVLGPRRWGPQPPGRPVKRPPQPLSQLVDRPRAHPRGGGRSLPAGLCRDPPRWDQPDRGRVPGQSPGLVRRPRCGHPTGADRQRQLLPPAAGRG